MAWHIKRYFSVRLLPCDFSRRHIQGLNIMARLDVRKAFPRPAIAMGDDRGESLLPRPVLREIALILALVVIFSVARTSPPLAGMREVVAWLAVAVFCIAFLIVTVRPLAVVVALSGLCGIALQAISVDGTALLMVVVAIIQASRLANPMGPAIALAI